MTTFLVLISISAFTFGLNFGIGEILPSRLQGRQCKEVCEIAGACKVDGVPQDIKCNVGSKQTNCCDYFGLQ